MIIKNKVKNKVKKIYRKGLEEYVVVPIGVFFIFALAIVAFMLGGKGLLQSHVLVQQKFAFESKFSNLIGQSTQILTVSKFKELDKKLVALNKSLNNKLSNWLAFYIHSLDSNSELHFNVTNPESEKINPEDLKIILKERINETAQKNIPKDIFYTIKIGDLVLKNVLDRAPRTLGMAVLPIPVPGEEIKYFEFTREETTYKLSLVQKETGIKTEKKTEK